MKIDLAPRDASNLVKFLKDPGLRDLMVDHFIVGEVIRFIKAVEKAQQEKLK